MKYEVPGSKTWSSGQLLFIQGGSIKQARTHASVIRPPIEHCFCWHSLPLTCSFAARIDFGVIWLNDHAVPTQRRHRNVQRIFAFLPLRPLPPPKYSALRHGTCWLAPHRWHRGECHGVAQQFSGGSLGGRESIAWGWQVDTFDTFRRSNPATRGWLWSWGDGWKGSKIDATLLFLQSKWVKYRETILVLSKCCPEGSAACGWVGDPDGISPGDLDGRAWRAKPIAEVWQPG